MNGQDFSITVLRRLTEIVKSLTPEQLDQVVKGTASLTFVPPGAVVDVPGPDVNEVRKHLANAQSRHDANVYLAGLKLKKKELVALAQQLDIAVTSRDTMPTLQRKIVDGTVGTREDAAAIRER